MTKNIEACPFDIDPCWKKVLSEELKKPYIFKLASFLAKENRLNSPIYPPNHLIFNALRLTSFKNVKVVIVGQDPYHGQGQAHGLSFSVPKGVAIPPSLRNIFKELVSDLGIAPPKSGCLIPWAEQGVLLLNAALTVRKGSPMSHRSNGWELFTDVIIEKLLEREEPLVFVLWGNAAKKKCQQIKLFQDSVRHTVLTAPHPSPLSAYNGFFGCRHFSKINSFLKQHNVAPIDWRLT